MDPNYSKVNGEGGMDSQMLTGDKCADKAILGGHSPPPPDTDYEGTDEEYTSEYDGEY